MPPRNSSVRRAAPRPPRLVQSVTVQSAAPDASLDATAAARRAFDQAASRYRNQPEQLATLPSGGHLAEVVEQNRKILQQQHEILQRLSAMDSRLTKIGQRLDAVLEDPAADEGVEAAASETPAPTTAAETTPETDAPDGPAEPSETPEEPPPAA